MTNTKVQLSCLEDEMAKKLKRGLIKKVQELCTIRGVECCTVIYEPGCLEPNIWPSRLATEHVIGRYQELPSFEKTKRMEDQESFANQKLAKTKKQLEKMQKKNRLKELSIIVNRNMSNNKEWVQNLDNDNLTYINNHALKPQLEEIERRMVMLKQELNATPQE